VPLSVSRLQKFDFSLSPEGFESGKVVKLKLPPKGRTPVKLDLRLDPKEGIASLRAFDVSLTLPNGDILGGVRIVTVIRP
jgi:hypothetical protein